MNAATHNDGLSGGPPRIFTSIELPSGTLVIGSCTRGMSRSIDRGQTWHRLDTLRHVSINTLVLGSDGALLAATSGGLARSVDEAQTWQMISEKPIYAATSSGADQPPNTRVFRLVELDDQQLLAGTDGDGVWHRDQTEWAQTRLQDAVIYALACTANGAWLAGTRTHGVMRSDDQGHSWQPTSGLPDPMVHCLATPASGEIVAGTGAGIAISSDDGRSWRRGAELLAHHRIFSLASLTDGQLIAGTYDRMWIGAGSEWTEVDHALTPDESWSVHFGVDGTLYAGTKGGLITSTTGGQSWNDNGPGAQVLGFSETPDHSVLAGTDDGVLISPNWTHLGQLRERVRPTLELRPGVVLAGTFGAGLWRFENDTWAPVDNGPPHPLIYDLAKTRTGLLLAATAAVIDGKKDGGIFISDDDGLSWAPTLSGRGIYALSTSSNGVLYAGGQRCHIYRSADDGLTWQPCASPVEAETKMFALSVARCDYIYIGTSAGFLRSVDAGQSWQHLDDGLDGVSVYAIAENEVGTLVAATSSGIYRSTTNGDTWQPAGPNIDGSPDNQAI